MYRVYDNVRKRWVRNIYMSPSPYSFLYIEKFGIFGGTKLVPVESDRYTVHMEIGMPDKNDELIYEGDFVRAQVSNDKSVIGLVAYAYELSAYIILCEETGEWFSLGSDVSKDVEVIGNVFDGYEVKQNEQCQQTLQEQEGQTRETNT